MTDNRYTSSSRTGQCTRMLRGLGLALAFSTAPLAISALLAPSAMAQVTTADIVGTVTDATGAVIPNAQVTVVNLDTHETRTDTASGSGDYQFTLLPVGRYSITVKVTGFKTYTTPLLAVEAGDRARNDVHMVTGGESETVTVESTTPLLQADNATVSSTITAVAVQDLPLNGRNYVQLVQLVPGANEGPGNGLTSGGRPDDRRPTSSFSVNGQDDTLNNTVVDGIDDNERIIGTAGIKPDVEGIQEITVQTNSYAAEAGRTAGGVVSIITRSGTNQFHGTAYEFFRNDIFDAKNVLQTTGRKPELRQNQFGGSIGGPIFKDRTFFFGDYEGFRLVSGLTYTSTVPTIDEYNDINSLNGGTPQALVNAGNGTAGLPIDPVALNYLKLFPGTERGCCRSADQQLRHQSQQNAVRQQLRRAYRSQVQRPESVLWPVRLEQVLGLHPSRPGHCQRLADLRRSLHLRRPGHGLLAAVWLRLDSHLYAELPDRPACGLHAHQQLLRTAELRQEPGHDRRLWLKHEL